MRTKALLLGIGASTALLIATAPWETLAVEPQGLSGGAHPFSAVAGGRTPAHAANGFGNAAAGHPGGGQQHVQMPQMNQMSDDDFDDDDDDDDLDFGGFDPALLNQLHHPPDPRHHQAALPHHAPISAGGKQSTANVPDPIQTENGIAVGGATANGVLAKNKTPLVQVNADTGEGKQEAIITDFNYPDADILDIAKTLGKLTGKNFMYDKDVKGRITIVTNSPITVGDAWRAFLTALDTNGFALIPSGTYLKIAKQRDARDKQLKTYVGDSSPDTDALISRIFPLKYISADEVARTFRNFMPANARVIPYEQTNTVIVTDTGSNITKLAKMLETLDVEGYDAGIEVIPVRYASALDLSKLIDALIPGTSTASPGGSPASRFISPTAGRFSARKTKEGGVINTIIADERTNMLIVHANSKGTDQVRELVSKLDQRAPSSRGGGRVHVVYLQFADAEQIANTLNSFSSQANTTAKPAGTPGAGTGVNPVEASLFQGAIKISPDKATNALVITASPSDFITVHRVINQLDILRDQVYVQVIIMEVAVSKTSNFSANLINAPSFLGSLTNGDLAKFLQSPLSSQGAMIGIPLGGTTSVQINNTQQNIPSVLGLITALQGDNSADILATPQIIALDNTEANFETAQKIPVQTTTLVQGVGSSQTITKEPVALSIKIKPQINKITNFVKLDVTTKLGDISQANVPASLQGQAFSTNERTAQTSVVVADSDTIVLGGLMQDRITDSLSKIPILGDIPILGWLFKSKTSQSTKSNLLVFMTPHIIRPYEKVRTILDKKLKERDEFLEANYGRRRPHARNPRQHDSLTPRYQSDSGL